MDSVSIASDFNLNEMLSDHIHSKSLMLQCKIPEICKTEPCVLGVDEAGRGPVLGPMVYGICYHPLSKSDDLLQLGCADSKTLNEDKREDIFAAIRACDDFVGWAVDIISPNYISNCMLRRDKYSLNEIALDSTVKLIQCVINAGAKITEIFVDTVGPPEKHEEKLSNIFPSCKIKVAKKADALFPIVSAASICAKVCRDRAISNWKFFEGTSGFRNYGSGYPNDPDTKKFLAENLNTIFGFANIVRFSWSTASKILESAAATVEWDEEDQNECQNIKTFFKQKNPLKKHEMKHPYFQENFLFSASDF